MRGPLLALGLLLLGCSGLLNPAQRGDDRVQGSVLVNGRAIPARDWCPSRLGTGGEIWTFALSDPLFVVGEVGLRAGEGPLFVGVYSAEKGEVPKGEVNDFGVVEIGEEPCVRLLSTAPGAGKAVFDCRGAPQGVTVPGGPAVLEVRGELLFEGCPFP